jgi:hypothetical protein
MRGQEDSQVHTNQPPRQIAGETERRHPEHGSYLGYTLLHYYIGSFFLDGVIAYILGKEGAGGIDQ